MDEEKQFHASEDDNAVAEQSFPLSLMLESVGIVLTDEEERELHKQYYFLYETYSEEEHRAIETAIEKADERTAALQQAKLDTFAESAALDAAKIHADEELAAIRGLLALERENDLKPLTIGRNTNELNRHLRTAKGEVDHAASAAVQAKLHADRDTHAIHGNKASTVALLEDMNRVEALIADVRPDKFPDGGRPVRAALRDMNKARAAAQVAGIEKEAAEQEANERAKKVTEAEKVAAAAAHACEAEEAKAKKAGAFTASKNEKSELGVSLMAAITHCHAQRDALQAATRHAEAQSSAAKEAREQADKEREHLAAALSKGEAVALMHAKLQADEESELLVQNKLNADDASALYSDIKTLIDRDNLALDIATDELVRDAEALVERGDDDIDSFEQYRIATDTVAEEEGRALEAKKLKDIEERRASEAQEARLAEEKNAQEAEIRRQQAELIAQEAQQRGEIETEAKALDEAKDHAEESKQALAAAGEYAEVEHSSLSAAKVHADAEAEALTKAREAAETARDLLSEVLARPPSDYRTNMGSVMLGNGNGLFDGFRSKPRKKALHGRSRKVDPSRLLYIRADRDSICGVTDQLASLGITDDDLPDSSSKEFSSVHDANPRKVALREARERAADAALSLNDAKRRTEEAKEKYNQQNVLANKENENFLHTKNKNEAIEKKVLDEFGEEKVRNSENYPDYEKCVNNMKTSEESAATYRSQKDFNVDAAESFSKERESQEDAVEVAKKKRHEAEVLLAQCSSLDKEAEGVALDQAKAATDEEAVSLLEATMLFNKECDKWKNALEQAIEETNNSSDSHQHADEAARQMTLIRGGLLGSYKDALDAIKKDLAEAEKGYIESKATADDISDSTSAAFARNNEKSEKLRNSQFGESSSDTPKLGAALEETNDDSERRNAPAYLDSSDTRYTAYTDASRRAADFAEQARATRGPQNALKEKTAKLRAQREHEESIANGFGAKRLEAEEAARRAAAKGDKEHASKWKADAEKYAEEEGRSLKAAAELANAEADAWRDANALADKENDLMKSASSAAAEAAKLLAEMELKQLQKLRDEVKKAEDDAAAAAKEKILNVMADAINASAVKIDFDSSLPEGSEGSPESKDYQDTLRACGAIEEKLRQAVELLKSEEIKAVELHADFEKSKQSADSAEAGRLVAAEALENAIKEGGNPDKERIFFDDEHGYASVEKDTLGLAVEQARGEEASWERIGEIAAEIQQLADAMRNQKEKARFQFNDIDLSQLRNRLAEARTAAAIAEAEFNELNNKVDRENEELNTARDHVAQYEADLPESYKTTPAYQEYVMASQLAVKEAKAQNFRAEKSGSVKAAQEAKKKSNDRELEADEAMRKRHEVAEGTASSSPRNGLQQTKEERTAALSDMAKASLQSAKDFANEEESEWKKSCKYAERELEAVTAAHARLMGVLRSGLLDKYKDDLDRNKKEAEKAEDAYIATKRSVDAVSRAVAAEKARREENKKLLDEAADGEHDASLDAYVAAAAAADALLGDVEALRVEQEKAIAKANECKIKREQEEDIARSFAEKRSEIEEALKSAIEAEDREAEESLRSEAQRLTDAEAAALKNAAELAHAEYDAWREADAAGKKEKDIMDHALLASVEASKLLADVRNAKSQKLKDDLLKAQEAAAIAQEDCKQMTVKAKEAATSTADLDATAPEHATADSPEYVQYLKQLDDVNRTNAAMIESLDGLEADDAKASELHAACAEEKAKSEELDDKLRLAKTDLDAAIVVSDHDLERKAFENEKMFEREEETSLLKAIKLANEEEEVWKNALRNASSVCELATQLEQMAKDAQRILADVELTRERRLLAEAKSAAATAEKEYNESNDLIEKENEKLKETRARNSDYEQELPENYKETPAFQNYIVASQAVVKNAKAVEKRQEKMAAVPKAMQAKQSCAREKRNADSYATRRSKIVDGIRAPTPPPPDEVAANSSQHDAAITGEGDENDVVIKEQRVKDLSAKELQALRDATAFALEEEAAWRKAAYLANKELDAVNAALLRAQEATKLLEALRNDQKENDRNALALGITLAEDAEKKFKALEEEIKTEAKVLTQVKGRNEKLEVALSTETKETVPEYNEFTGIQDIIDDCEGRAAAARANKENEVAQALEARRKRVAMEEEADEAEKKRQSALAAASTAAARGDRKAEDEALAMIKDYEEITDKKLKSATDWANEETENWTNATLYGEEENDALGDAHDMADNAMLLLAMMQAAQKEREMMDAYNNAKDAAEAAKDTYMEVEEAIKAEQLALDELEEQNSRGDKQLSEDAKSGIDYERYQHALNAMKIDSEAAKNADTPKSERVLEAEKAAEAGEIEVQKANDASENMKTVVMDTVGDAKTPGKSSVVESNADEMDFVDVYRKQLGRPKSSFNLGRHVDTTSLDDGEDSPSTKPEALPSPIPPEHQPQQLTKKSSLARIKSILSNLGSIGDIASNASEAGSIGSNVARNKAAYLHQQLRDADEEALKAETLLAEVEEAALAAAAEYAKQECESWKAATPLAERERKHLTDAHEHALQAARLLALMLSGDHEKENQLKLMASLETAESAARRYQEAEQNTKKAADNLATTRAKKASLEALLDEESRETPEYEDYLASQDREDGEKGRYETARANKETNVQQAELSKREREALQKKAEQARKERQAADKAANSLASAGNKGAENAVLEQVKKWATEEDAAVLSTMEKLVEEAESWKVATQYTEEEKDGYICADDIAQAGMLLLAVLKANQDERILLRALGDANDAADEAKAAFEAADRIANDLANDLRNEKDLLQGGDKLSTDSKDSPDFEKYKTALQQYLDAEKKANELRQQKNVQVLTANSAREQRGTEEEAATEAGEKMRSVLVEAEEEQTINESDKGKLKGRAALVDFGSVYENPNMTPLRSADKRRAFSTKDVTPASATPSGVTPSGRHATRLGRVHGILADIGAEDNGDYYRNLQELGRSASSDAETDEKDSPFRTVDNFMSPGTQIQEDRAALRLAEKKALEEEKKWADIEEKKLKSAVAYAGIECTSWNAATPLANDEARALGEARKHAHEAARLLAALMGNAEAAALQGEKNEAESLHKGVVEKQLLASQLSDEFQKINDQCASERKALQELKVRLNTKGNQLERRGMGFEDEIDEYHRACNDMQEKEVSADQIGLVKSTEIAKGYSAHDDLQKLLRDNGDADNNMILQHFDRGYPTIIINNVEYTKPAAARRRRLAAELASELAADCDDVGILTKALQQAKVWTEEEEKARKALVSTKLGFFEYSAEEGDPTIVINDVKYTKPTIARAMKEKAEKENADARQKGDDSKTDRAEDDAQHWIHELAKAKDGLVGLERVLQEQPEDEDHTKPDWDALYPNVVVDNSVLPRPSIARRRSSAYEKTAEESSDADINENSEAMNNARFWQRENVRALHAGAGVAAEELRSVNVAKEKAEEELIDLKAARAIGEEEERKLDAILNQTPYRSSMGTVCMGGGGGLFPGKKEKTFANGKNKPKKLNRDMNDAVGLPSAAVGRPVDITALHSTSDFNEVEYGDDKLESKLMYDMEANWLTGLLESARQDGPYYPKSNDYMTSKSDVLNAQLSDADAALLREQRMKLKDHPLDVASNYPHVAHFTADQVAKSLGNARKNAIDDQKFLHDNKVQSSAGHDDPSDMTEFENNMDLYQQSRKFVANIDSLDDLELESGDDVSNDPIEAYIRQCLKDPSGIYEILAQIPHLACRKKPYVTTVTADGVNALAFPLSGGSGSFPKTTNASSRSYSKKSSQSMNPLNPVTQQKMKATFSPSKQQDHAVTNAISSPGISGRIKHHGSIPDAQDNPIGGSPRTRSPRPNFAPRSSDGNSDSRPGSPRPLQSILRKPSMERLDNPAIGGSGSIEAATLPTYSPMESPSKSVHKSPEVPPLPTGKPPSGGMRLSSNVNNLLQRPPRTSVKDKTDEEQAADNEKRKSRGAAFLTQKPGSLLKSRSVANRHSLARTQSASTPEFDVDMKRSSSTSAPRERSLLVSKFSNRSLSQRIPSTEAMDLYGINDTLSADGSQPMTSSKKVTTSGTEQEKTVKKTSSFKSDSAMLQEMISGNVKL